MAKSNHKAITEALLFTAGDAGLSNEQIAKALDISAQDVEELMANMKQTYQNDSSRGIEVAVFAEKYQFVTKKALSDYIKLLADSPSPSTLTQAGLETLAIIAYKQPVTRVQMEEVRGVKTDGPVHTLLARGLIKEVGRNEGAGRAILYGTTEEFLDYLGLKDLSELPPLPEDIEEDEKEDSDLFFESLKNGLSGNE
ncbi:SMC-Scp complex subunit ScpB [Jeotgalibacillus haloalkalitolerans]|uniref:Segregation and condensation protein B n=1 Tax=Jeotgalibacillus haloalkalitolerans TaxID=3104292 RepID=A0ABU5KMS1_9BACL|nr:SMC-Scp complex subunit ScpB [Jeotgalibacillus sp. HH7-29]MDZ5712051.1 SMC-Scp complex subunit ScpB [Jeotgalibacillus sp. HH7-29]